MDFWPASLLGPSTERVSSWALASCKCCSQELGQKLSLQPTLVARPCSGRATFTSPGSTLLSTKLAHLDLFCPLLWASPNWRKGGSGRSAQLGGEMDSRQQHSLLRASSPLLVPVLASQGQLVAILCALDRPKSAEIEARDWRPFGLDWRLIYSKKAPPFSLEVSATCAFSPKSCQNSAKTSPKFQTQIVLPKLNQKEPRDSFLQKAWRETRRDWLPTNRWHHLRWKFRQRE